MKYMLLIYSDPSRQQNSEKIQEWLDFTAETAASGVNLSAYALQPTESATTIRSGESQVLVMDGPFAETKEVLGGYYLMECQDLDDALSYARRLNAIEGSTVEVRPVVEF